MDELGLLQKLDAIPVLTWNWKAQAPAIRHLGPTAQDFRAAFGLGEDEKRISTVDAEGVVLPGVQALYRLVREKEARIERLERELAELRAAVAQLAGQVQAAAPKQ